MIHAVYINLVRSHRMLLCSIQFDGDITMLCGMQIISKHATHCVCALFESQQLQTCWLYGILLWYLTKLITTWTPDNTFFTEITQLITTWVCRSSNPWNREVGFMNSAQNILPFTLRSYRCGSLLFSETVQMKPTVTHDNTAVMPPQCILCDSPLEACVKTTGLI